MSASAVSSGSDLPCQPSISMAELQADQTRNLGSMNMDELLKSIYGADAAANNISSEPFQSSAESAAAASPSLPKNVGNRTVDEVWNDIVSGRGGVGEGGGAEGMTLEDFLAKAASEREEDVRATTEVVAGPIFQPQGGVEGSMEMGFGNGIDGRSVSGSGRGKRRPVEEPVDKAAQQKQRRMIKNRESAARSRERKQAYTMELESLVTQLEEENASLLREEVRQTKQRFKQLMENVIPVVEKRKPACALRKVHSGSW